MAERPESRREWLQKKKTYCVITGASRGLGKILAVHFSPCFAKESVIVLVARDAAGLQNVKAEVEASAPGVKVLARSVDLGDPKTCTSKVFEELLASSLGQSETEAAAFDQAIIFHNAGSVGRCAAAEDYGNPQEWTDYLMLNVTSAACLNCAFLKTFREADVGQRLVINISSLAAFKPLLSCGLYNTGKAAREAYFKTLAAEDDSVTVLNYSPGPLDTDMFHYVSENVIHPQAKDVFTDIIASGRLLTCEMTTKKLLHILTEESFQSGDRVDYYDRK